MMEMKVKNFLNDLLKTNEKINKFKNNISDIFPDWNNWYKDISIKNNKNDKNGKFKY